MYILEMCQDAIATHQQAAVYLSRIMSEISNRRVLKKQCKRVRECTFYRHRGVCICLKDTKRLLPEEETAWLEIKVRKKTFHYALPPVKCNPSADQTVSLPRKTAFLLPLIADPTLPPPTLPRKVYPQNN